VLGPQPGFSKLLDARQELRELDPLLHCGLRVPLVPMPGLPPARLRQARVVVRDVEPPRFSICVGVDELVREVLLSGVFSHLDARPSDYSRIAGAWLRLHPEEFPV
jgi:hypothetical protein